MVAPEWYPQGLAARDRLAVLAERLDAVEVDSSFHALPAARTVDRWARGSTEGLDTTLAWLESVGAAYRGVDAPETESPAGSRRA